MTMLVTCDTSCPVGCVDHTAGPTCWGGYLQESYIVLVFGDCVWEVLPPPPPPPFPVDLIPWNRRLKNKALRFYEDWIGFPHHHRANTEKMTTSLSPSFVFLLSVKQARASYTCLGGGGGGAFSNHSKNFICSWPLRHCDTITMFTFVHHLRQINELYFAVM